jgi:hypothetical protein
MEDNEETVGAGRELPHKGLSELHPERNSNANVMADTPHAPKRT